MSPEKNSSPQKTPLYALGIDAGGTFTDAALVDLSGGEVRAFSKAPTTPHDPIGGIRAALLKLPREMIQKSEFASLATTFATNAIVEGRGGRAGLILIGYDRDLPGLSAMSPILHIDGGHDYWGEEQGPLDLDRLSSRIDGFSRGLEAVAVSGYFSVRNPDHEQRVERMVRDRCRLPTVCGHRLSARIDAPKRAATAWWNGRLIPLLSRLIDAAQEVLAEFDIDAPLMVVRGDGALMSAREAKLRPVETLVSGPAAGILGARHLTGLDNALVVDIGGTTTDMATLVDGKVDIDPEGARIGRWKTHVEAARIRTAGLGGDSIIETADGKIEGIAIGPARVEPLCAFADRFPEILPVLETMSGSRSRLSLRLSNPCSFYIRSERALSGGEAIPRELARGPVNEFLIAGDPASGFTPWDLKSLAMEGLLTRASLTPTDILAAQGRYELGCWAGARLGVAVFARALGISEEALFRSVTDAMGRRLCGQAASHLTGDDAQAIKDLTHRWFPSKANRDNRKPDLSLQAELTHPVIGIGAPAEAWLPDAFAHLHARCVLPERYSVGTAVGAVVGTVGFTLTAEVRPTASDRFILYGPREKKEFDNSGEAMAAGREALESLAIQRMRANCIEQPQLSFTEERISTPVPGGELYLYTLLQLRAAGRLDVAGTPCPESSDSKKD